LRQIGKQRINDFNLDLIAQLFNPDRLIREIAGWALYRIDPRAYETHSARLGEDVKRWLDRAVIEGKRQTKLMIFEKVLFFQSIKVFEGIPGISLSFLADISKEVRLKAEEFLAIDEKMNNDFFIIYEGASQYYEKGRYIMDYSKGQFIGEMLSPSGFANSNLLIAKEDSILLKINKDQFYELLADNVRLADKVLEYV
jgi:hypothetical protein